MILINNTEYKPTTFPDGTFCMLNMPALGAQNYIYITWKYDNDAELVALQYIVSHIRENYSVIDKIFLVMPYIPNARMDRVDPNCKAEQVFTLKYFANIINSMNFAQVIVLDPHSTVSVALLNNVVELDVSTYVNTSINNIIEDFNVNRDNLIIYTPDAGAYKRYSSLLKKLNIPFIYGEKIRDFATGKIEGLRIITNGMDLSGKTILMVDDIIAYGGTFFYSAQELKNQGVAKIFAYATHTENSIFELDYSKEPPVFKSKFLKMIYSGEVERLYTTDTIFRGSSDNHIKVIQSNLI